MAQIQGTQFTQRKVQFGNGKTFYVDMSPKINPNSPQSLTYSKLSEGAYPYQTEQSFPNCFWRSRADFPSQKVNHFQRICEESKNSAQHFPVGSHPHEELDPNLKSNKKNRNNNQEQQRRHLAKSCKKHKIFQAKNNRCNGIYQSHINFQEIEIDHPYKFSNAKINNIDESTAASKSIGFTRINKAKSAQQISSYKKNPIANINFSNPYCQAVSSSQPLNHHQTYITFKTRNVSLSPRQKVDFIPQVESKHEIGVHQSKTSLGPLVQLQNNHNYHQIERSLNCKQSKNITREIQIYRQDIKTSQLKGHMQIFCEESTIKPGCEKADGKIESNHDVSISNIQQDNSFSRYFDNDDDLLPMLNKVSYKNVEIESKAYQKPDEIVTHNIFMDFQKAPHSPLLNKRQSKQMVHYDCTLTKPQQNKSINRLKLLFGAYFMSLSNKMPVFLILVAFTLLLVQILA